MVYVLTFEYCDKSGFYVCGVTDHELVALAWSNSDTSQCKYYACAMDDLRSVDRPHEAAKRP